MSFTHRTVLTSPSLSASCPHWDFPRPHGCDSDPVSSAYLPLSHFCSARICSCLWLYPGKKIKIYNNWQGTYQPAGRDTSYRQLTLYQDTSTVPLLCKVALCGWFHLLSKGLSLGGLGHSYSLSDPIMAPKHRVLHMVGASHTSFIQKLLTCQALYIAISSTSFLSLRELTPWQMR